MPPPTPATCLPRPPRRCQHPQLGAGAGTDPIPSLPGARARWGGEAWRVHPQGEPVPVPSGLVTDAGRVAGPGSRGGGGGSSACCKAHVAAGMCHRAGGFSWPAAQAHRAAAARPRSARGPSGLLGGWPLPSLHPESRLSKQAARGEEPAAASLPGERAGVIIRFQSVRAGDLLAPLPTPRGGWGGLVGTRWAPISPLWEGETEASRARQRAGRFGVPTCLRAPIPHPSAPHRCSAASAPSRSCPPSPRAPSASRPRRPPRTPGASTR